MSFEEGREEFIKAGLKKKRVDDIAKVAVLLTGPTIVMEYPTVTFMVEIIALILIFHMARLSKQIFEGRAALIALIYSCLCLPATLLNFYLGTIMLLIGYGKFARNYRAQAGLSDRFMEAQNDPRYAGIILSMIVCIILALVYSFKILPVVLRHIQ